MVLGPLDQQLDDHDRQIVAQALRAIVELPDRYLNRFVVTRGRDAYTYSVLQRDGADPSPALPPLASPNDITQPLLALGYLAATTTAGHFAFTDEALGWYRQAASPADQEVRRRLGLHLLGALQQRGTYAGNEPLDLAAVARALRVPPERLLANARALETLGYVKSGPADHMTIEAGFIFLTTPLGVAWASDGAPPMGTDGRPVADAPARVTPDQLLDRAERSALSERHKERFQTLLTRLERDKGQGRDMVYTVKDLLDVARNSGELLPLVLRFAAELVEDAQRAMQGRPGR